MPALPGKGNARRADRPRNRLHVHPRRHPLRKHRLPQNLPVSGKIPQKNRTERTQTRPPFQRDLQAHINHRHVSNSQQGDFPVQSVGKLTPQEVVIEKLPVQVQHSQVQMQRVKPVQHVQQHGIAHDPRSSQPTTISNMHDSHHIRHRQTSYTAPNVPIVNTNTTNSLRTNLITVPIQDNAIAAPIHDAIPTANYYNQYPAAGYAQTMPVHSIPPSPILPLHSMNVPPPHLSAQAQSGSYYAQPAYTQSAQTYPSGQFASQYSTAPAPNAYPAPATQGNVVGRVGYEYNGNQQWTQGQQYYR